jgi:hypothetical protein
LIFPNRAGTAGISILRGFDEEQITIQSSAGDSEHRRNGGAFNPKGAGGPSLSRLGAKGAAAPFVKALENKKSSQIALRLNSYKNSLLTCGTMAQIPGEAKCPVYGAVTGHNREYFYLSSTILNPRFFS